VSNPLSHNGKLNKGTSFLALNKNDKMRQQNKNFVSNVFDTAELLSFQRKARMRRYNGAQREAIEWEDYRRIVVYSPIPTRFLCFFLVKRLHIF
jgi:hypothetical protein